jgi:hypothetical protein
MMMESPFELLHKLNAALDPMENDSLHHPMRHFVDRAYLGSGRRNGDGRHSPPDV